MRLRLITGLFLVMAFIRCGQSPDIKRPAPDGNRTQDKASRSAGGRASSDAGPIDRHVSRLVLTRHARCRMDCRHITEKEIREVLESGEIDYRKSSPNAHPDPKYALEGYTKEGQHLRIIIAVPTRRAEAGNSLVVVTCMELGVEWHCDCH